MKTAARSEKREANEKKKKTQDAHFTVCYLFPPNHIGDSTQIDRISYEDEDASFMRVCILFLY